MKRRACIFAGLLLGVGAAISSANAECVLRHVYEEWPPYLYRDAAGSLAGLDMELATVIFKQAGCTLQTLEYIPSRRRDLYFKQGKVDLIMAASDIPERRSYARFSVGYRMESIRLFAKPARLTELHDLKSFTEINQSRLSVLAPITGWYGPDYAGVANILATNARLSNYITHQQAITMFSVDRADLLMGDDASIDYAARQGGIELAVLPYVVHTNSVHMMLSKYSTSESDLEKINAAIDHLEKNGTLEAIRARYKVR